MKEKELYNIVRRIIIETPIEKFEKTIRGLCLPPDNLEFIFATDKKVYEDQSIIIKSQKNVHYLHSYPDLRKDLLKIYEHCNFIK